MEAATLITAAVICALVSNALASRERKLVVVSSVASSPRVARVAEPAGTPTQSTSVPAGVSPAAEPAGTPAPTQTTSGQSTGVAAGVSPAGEPAQPPTRSTPAAPQKKTPLELPIKSVKAATQKPATGFNPHPDKPYIEISGDAAASLHSKGVLFLDARRTSVYEQGHIPGARPYSVWESDIDEKVNKLFAERPDPKDQNLPIVAYCSGGDCEDSHMLAQKLWGIGFNNVYVYKDGFPDWQKRGEPVHTGANP